MVTPLAASVNKPSYSVRRKSAARVTFVHPPLLAAAGVDWSQVHAVRLLGVALAAIFLLWAIRRMFGGK
jgi:hypothetical protein